MNPSKRKMYAILAGVGISLGAAGIASAASTSGSTAASASVAAAATVDTAVTEPAADDTTTDAADDSDTDGLHSANGVTEAELTGADASSVEAAVLAAYPDATIDRMETDAEGAAFEAHITLADGSDATVKLDASFAITATETGEGHGGHGGHGDGGPHAANGITEAELTGTDASSVEAAVLAAYPDATIDRMETDAEGAAFEAHITLADGSDATVKLDASFAITATETHG